jgi:hypothetical protein
VLRVFGIDGVGLVVGCLGLVVEIVTVFNLGAILDGGDTTRCLLDGVAHVGYLVVSD